MNQINYLLGANESGKSNILNALRIADLDNQESFYVEKSDKTIRSSKFVEEEIKIVVERGGAINVFGSHSKKDWFFVNSTARGKYISYIDEFKKILPNIQTLIEQKNNNNSPMIQICNSLIEYKYIEVNKIESFFDNLGQYKEIKDGIITTMESMEVKVPRIHYVEPIIKAKTKGEIRYQYNSLFVEDSILNNIFINFAPNELKSFINESPNSNEDKNMRARGRARLFDKINENIKSYFGAFEYISAYPRFIHEESSVILDIVSKDKNWEIDASDENQRSLGYKCFLRIFTEILALKSSNKEIIYIIDEPEQSLHPYLQEEMIKKIKKLLENSTNVTFVLATQSPFCIQLDKPEEMRNISFAKRNKIGGTEIEEISNSSVWREHHNDYLNGKITEENHLFKILIDSIAGKRYPNFIKKQIKEIYRNYKNGKITEEEFQERLSQKYLLKEWFK